MVHPLKMSWRTHAHYLLKLMHPIYWKPSVHHLIAPMSVSNLGLISTYPDSVNQMHNSIDNGSLSVAYESQTLNYFSFFKENVRNPVHRAHRLKSAGLDHVKWHWGFSTVRNFAGTTTCCPNGLDFFRQHFFLLSGAVAKSLVGCFLLCKCALVCGKQAPQ